MGSLDGFWKPALLRSPPIFFWAYDFGKWVLLPLCLLWLLHRITDISPRDYGLIADRGMRDILMLLPVPFITLLMADVFTIGMADWILRPPPPEFNYASVLAPLGPLWIVGTFYASITAGVWESIFVLGLPWFWFSQRQPVTGQRVIAFAVVSAAVFALCHWENGISNALGAFVFQLLAVHWYLKFGTLWPVIGAHTLTDVYYFWPPASV